MRCRRLWSCGVPRYALPWVSWTQYGFETQWVCKFRDKGRKATWRLGWKLSLDANLSLALVNSPFGAFSPDPLVLIGSG